MQILEKKKKSSGNPQFCTIDSKTIYTDESIAVLRNLKKIYIKLLSQTDSDISNPITNHLIKNIYIYIFWKLILTSIDYKNCLH